MTLSPWKLTRVNSFRASFPEADLESHAPEVFSPRSEIGKSVSKRPINVGRVGGGGGGSFGFGLGLGFGFGGLALDGGG